MDYKEYYFGNPDAEISLSCALIKTTKRITFEIMYQSPLITNEDENGIDQFRASNGYEIISEHRMDIQSRRIWLLGAANDQSAQRSGTLAIPTQDMCDETFPQFLEALEEYAIYKNISVKVLTVEF